MIVGCFVSLQSNLTAFASHYCLVMSRLIVNKKDGFAGERSVVLPPMAIGLSKNDPLVNSLYVTDIRFYTHESHHFRRRTQPINQFVLIYCVDGSGFYEVNGMRQEVCACQYFILPANMPHCYGSDSDNPWTIYWVHFAGEHAPIYAQGAATPQTVRPSMRSRIGERNNIFEEIFATLQAGCECERLRYASSLLHHYLASMRYLTLYRSAVRQPVTEEVGGAMVVTAVIRFLGENIERHVAIDELCQYTGYSHGHLSALFKKRTGHSITTHFNIMKMQLAAELISSSSLKMNQISNKVGIDDSYYFSRLFKKVYGVSPLSYRRGERCSSCEPTADEL